MRSYNPSMDIKKLAFTEEEIRKKMQRSPSLTNVYKAAKAAEKMKDWEIGTVLVSRSLRTGKLYLNNAGVPEKYIVVNKLGPFPICKRLMVNGKPGSGLYCPAIDEDPECTSFEEDPDAADAMILGFDYNPMEYPKKVGKARDRMRSYNNKISLYKYLQETLSSTSEDKVRSYLEDMVLLNGGLDIWWMEDDKTKVQMKITGIDSNGDAVAEYGNNKKILRMWNMTSRYSGSEYFIDEPKTINEELEKIR